MPYIHALMSAIDQKQTLERWRSSVPAVGKTAACPRRLIYGIEEKTLDAIAEKGCESMRASRAHIMRSYEAPQGLAALRGTTRLKQ